jgi:exodeoxyribonuclease VII large subunit
LPRALAANAQIHHTAYSRVADRLTPRLLRTRIVRERERLAMFATQSGRCLRVHVERRGDRYLALSLRLKAGRTAYVNARRSQLARARERIVAFHERAKLAVGALLQNRLARVERAERLLAAVSYRGVLARGFALVRDGEGQPLRAAAAVRPGLPLDIEFADGHVRAKAEGASSSAPPPAPAGAKPRRGGGNPGQGSLFGA